MLEGAQRQALMQVLTFGITRSLDQGMHYLFDATSALGNTRNLLMAYRSIMGDNGGPGLVCDVDQLKEAQSIVFDAIEKVCLALEPDDETLAQIEDDGQREELLNLIMRGRQNLAEARKDALEDEDDGDADG